MTTTIRMTEAVPSGAVRPLKSVRLRGDCLKVDPVCRHRAGLSRPEPVIGQTRQGTDSAPQSPLRQGLGEGDEEAPTQPDTSRSLARARLRDRAERATRPERR